MSHTYMYIAVDQNQGIAVIVRVRPLFTMYTERTLRGLSFYQFGAVAVVTMLAILRPAMASTFGEQSSV